MPKGYVLSDLHIFADRSNAKSYEKAVDDIARTANYIVLNGDIFDFRWSRHGSPDKTADAAVQWLADLALRHPQCQFYFIMGNHDGFQIMEDRLQALRIANLHWSPTHFILGRALFVHGDLPLSGQDPFNRTYKQPHRPERHAAHRAYNIAIALRIHRAMDLWTRKTICVPRLHRTLEKFKHPEMEGVKHVYFGHTHLGFEDFAYKGYIFHNTGAAIRGVKKHILSVKDE